MTLLQELKRDFKRLHWLNKVYWTCYPIWAIVIVTSQHYQFISEKQGTWGIIGFHLVLLATCFFLWLKEEGLFQGWTLIHHHLTGATFKAYGYNKKEEEKLANNGKTFTEWYREQNKIANPNYVEPDYEKDALNILEDYE